MLKAVLMLFRMDTKNMVLLMLAEKGELKVDEFTRVFNVNRKELVQIIQRIKRDGIDIEYDAKSDKYILRSQPVISADMIAERVEGDVVYGKLYGIIPVVVRGLGNVRAGSIAHVRGVVSEVNSNHIEIQQIDQFTS